MNETPLHLHESTENVILHYSDMVYRLAYARMGSKQDADEIYQEVFLRYIKKQPVFKCEEHRKAWLLRVTVNCSNSLWNSLWRKRTEALNEDLIFENQEEIDLSHALKALPARYREVIHLYYYEDMSTEEISRILGRKKSTIRTQLTRARAMLKEILKEDAYEIAQFFMPIQMTSEDQGIRMEVVSSYIHEDIAQIYITMEDLTEDRIDETMDLYDSYSIHQPFNSIATCERIGYVEETGKVTFMITLQEKDDEWDPIKIQGDKITFSIREFLSQKYYYTDQPIPIDLTDIPSDCNTMEVLLTGLSGNIVNVDQKKAYVLTPMQPFDEFPIDGIDFTAMGYVDGKLHLQTAIKNHLENDNHGFFYFMDRDGNKIFCDYSINFRENEGTTDEIWYEEDVFDIPIEKISEYSLYGNFVTSRMHVQGNWQVTFALE